MKSRLLLALSIASLAWLPPPSVAQSRAVREQVELAASHHRAGRDSEAKQAAREAEWKARTSADYLYVAEVYRLLGMDSEARRAAEEARMRSGR